MGIPGYFIDILKRNRKVLSLLQDSPHIDVLCVDANGVIYEIVRKIEDAERKTSTHVPPNERLAAMSPEQAAKYLAPHISATLARLPGLMGVSSEYMVAFDGVAPNAKIAQQRKRRFGRLILSKAMADVVGTAQSNEYFDTTQITPATPFMTALMPLVSKQLESAVTIKFRFSGSEEPGEGEHKIMDVIRSGVWKEENVVVHGLDADLILLALANQSHCASLRLAREAPSFIKHIDKTMDPHAIYVIDIPRFARIIGKTMGGGEQLAMTDYVFMMSMLGNDFMPHQPAISIRDNGIERVCKAFKDCLAENANFRLLVPSVSPNERAGTLVPHWQSVRELLLRLGEQEDKIMAAAAKRRQGFAHRAELPKVVASDSTTPSDLETIWNQLPALQMGLENWIAAGSEGWRERYYRHLLGEGTEVGNPWMRAATESWLAGLQWVWDYYTGNNAHWNWEYSGTHPPPLLLELANLGDYESGKDKLRDWRGGGAPISNANQLSQVLPPRKKGGEWVMPPIKLEWQYCRHAWEAELFA